MSTIHSLFRRLKAVDAANFLVQSRVAGSVIRDLKAVTHLSTPHFTSILTQLSACLSNKVHWQFWTWAALEIRKRHREMSNSQLSYAFLGVAQHLQFDPAKRQTLDPILDVVESKFRLNPGLTMGRQTLNRYIWGLAYSGEIRWPSLVCQVAHPQKEYLPLNTLLILLETSGVPHWWVEEIQSREPPFDLFLPFPLILGVLRKVKPMAPQLVELLMKTGVDTLGSPRFFISAKAPEISEFLEDFQGYPLMEAFFRRQTYANPDNLKFLRVLRRFPQGSQGLGVLLLTQLTRGDLLDLHQTHEIFEVLKKFDRPVVLEWIPRVLHRTRKGPCTWVVFGGILHLLAKNRMRHALLGDCRPEGRVDVRTASQILMSLAKLDFPPLDTGLLNWQGANLQSWCSLLTSLVLYGEIHRCTWVIHQILEEDSWTSVQQTQVLVALCAQVSLHQLGALSLPAFRKLSTFEPETHSLFSDLEDQVQAYLPTCRREVRLGPGYSLDFLLV